MSDDTTVVQPAIQLDHDFARPVIINVLKLTNVSYRKENQVKFTLSESSTKQNMLEEVVTAYLHKHPGITKLYMEQISKE